MAWLPCLPFPALTGPSRLPRAAGGSRVLCAPPALTCILGVWEPPQHPQAGGDGFQGVALALALPWLLGRAWKRVGPGRHVDAVCLQPSSLLGQGRATPPPPPMLCGLAQGGRCPGSQSGTPTYLGCMGAVGFPGPGGVGGSSKAFPLCAHARGTLVNRWCQYEPHTLPHLPVNTYVNSAKKLEERFSRCWRTAVRSLAAMKGGSPCQS